MRWTTSVQNALERILEQQKSIIKSINRLEIVVHSQRLKPGPISIKQTGESGNMLTFKVTLPPPAASDVVQRELTVKSSSGTTVTTYSADVLEVGDLTGEQDTIAIVSLVDIDDAGNRSEKSVSSVTLVDDIPPPAPGQITFQVTGEFETAKEDAVTETVQDVVTPAEGSAIWIDETLEDEADAADLPDTDVVEDSAEESK